MTVVIAGSEHFWESVGRRVRMLCGGFILAVVMAAGAAERFDDISISPQVFFQGQTFHGYVEMRFQVENQSADRTRKVTLATPHSAHGWGNNLRRVERTVTVSPGATVNVTLWQPPLMMNGDNQVDVSVDGRYRGAIPRGGNNQHMQRHAHSGIPGGPRAVLVSRSLNSDDLDKAFRGGSSAKAPVGHYSAEQAIGAPNVGRAGGMQPQAWSPDRVGSGGPEWLEVDFKPARLGAKQLRIHKLAWDQAFKEIVLKSADGTTLATLPVTNAVNRTFTLSILTVPLPPLTNAVGTVRLNVNAASSGGMVSVDAVELSDGSTSTFAADARPSSTWATRISPSSSTAYQGPTVLRSELEASGWSESWLAFTAFDLIVLSRTDLAAMNAAQQNALRSYVEAGGGLAVLGQTELPKEWRSAAIPNPSTFRPNGISRHYVGFGQCAVTEGASISALNRTHIDLLRELARESGQVWQAMPTEGNANSEFPVIEDTRIPVRGIVFIMLAFILVVGPLNIFLCARANNRIAMLWTIPLISFLTCAIVFGYSLASEGITPTTRTEAVTFLDQAAHRATTLARQAFYTPLTPGDGLRYSHDTEVTPLVDVNNYNGGNSRELELSQSQHLTRGWVTARVPAHFALRKSETRRERLQVQRLPDGRVSVLNGLGADIQTLWFRDDKGRLFKGEGLKAGQNVALQTEKGEAFNTGSSLGALYQGSWGAAHDALMTGPANQIRPNAYLAVMATAPFIETGLAKPGNARARQTIIGVLAPEDVK